jgi:energy-converting hydrogenase Eha subunit A
VTLPFFYLAPAWLMVGGVLLGMARPESFVAINEPRLLASVHAVAIGWLTTTIMGATYQLIPAVLGGRLLSHRLAPVHLTLHTLALALFVSGLYRWNLGLTLVAGLSLALALSLYVVNAGTGLIRATRSGPVRSYLATSLAFLTATVALGLLWVLSLRYGWMPVTLGRVAAHAHLALLGWIGLTVMGASYQLVPMFSIARGSSTRIPLLALGTTAGALVLFALAMVTDPSREFRLLLAGTLAIGPSLWLWDMTRLFSRRARRRLDIHGRASVASWVALGATAALGIMAAAGTPLLSDSQPARWPLAYGAAAMVGWAGASVVGNSFKIVPFVVWLHRHQRNVGRGYVPLVGDLSIHWIEHAVLGAALGAAILLVAGAATATVDVVHLAGWLLVTAGAGQLAAFLAVLRPVARRRGRHSPTTEGVSP